MTSPARARILTGRKIAFIFCAAFATIISANMALLYSSLVSFPGLETRAPYVESLTFETRRVAQEKLNWSSHISYTDGKLTLGLTWFDGSPVQLEDIVLVVGRATASHFDQQMNLSFDGQNYSTDIDLSAGNWRVHITATAPDGTLFSRILPLYIRPAS